MKSKLRTVSKLPFNLDRKLVTTVVTSAVTYVLVSVLGVDLDEDAKAGLSVFVGSIVAYCVPPSDVEPS